MDSLNNDKRFISLTYNTSGKSVFWISLMYFFVFFGLNLYLVSQGKPYTNKDPLYDEEILNYILRLVTVLIPTSIAIFTFTFKETKEAAYITLKTLNIKWPFVILNVSSFITLLSCIAIMWLDKNNSWVLNFYIIAFHSLISLVIFVFYIIKLINTMDLTKSMETMISRAKKCLDFLEANYNRTQFRDENIEFIFDQYTNYNEAIFHLYNQLMKRGHFKKLGEFQKSILSLNQKFLDIFVINIDKESLRYLLEENEKINADTIANHYNNILLNYRLVIRNANKHKLTLIQNELIEEMFKSSPLAIMDSYKESAYFKGTHEFDKLSQQVIRVYFSTAFELITELCEDDSVEFSYLLEMVSSCTAPLTTLKTNETKDTKSFEFYYDEMMRILESLTMWAVESKKVFHLTEIVNVLLQVKEIFNDEDLYGEFEHKMDKDRQLLNQMLKDMPHLEIRQNEDELQGNFMIMNKDMPESYHDNTPYEFKPNVKRDLLKVVFQALLKSIEISMYGCTGYIIKILNSNFKTAELDGYTREFYENSMDVEDPYTNHKYFHHSINDYSKEHCLNKLTLLIFLQVYERNEEKVLIDFVAEKIKSKEITYFIQKIEKASNKYGLLAVNQPNLQTLHSLYEYQVLKNSI